MKCYKIVVSLVFLLFSIKGHTQNATITGVVLNEQNLPVEQVNITVDVVGTSTDENGFYILEVPADLAITISFSHLGHHDIILKNLLLTTNEIYEFNPVLKQEVTQIAGVTVSPTGEKAIEGVTSVSPEVIRRIPGANAGVENIIKLLPGVSSNNELSTQYSVRGGNFDENLVYINEIEVYRPFLIRSAQQEGLSIVNSDMVQAVKFSSGGFQAKYGDKLASVLDISYKNPSAFGVLLDLSFLGASATLEAISKDKNFSSISSARYRNNSLLVNSQDTNTNFDPTFFDFQTYNTYRFSKKFHLNFLANISVNDYQNEPISRLTNFGTIRAPRSLVVLYEGQETTKYNTILGAFKGNYAINDKTVLKLIASLYHTTEEEYSDVIAKYQLGPLESEGIGGNSLGSSAQGIGNQFKRTRNDLDALIFNIEHKGIHNHGNISMDWGLKFTHEDIRDQLRESEFLDSLGYSVRPPLPQYQNTQPYEPFEAPLVAYSNRNARNFVKTDRVSGFFQFSQRTQIDSHNLYYNFGLRAQHWRVNGANLRKKSYTIVSPRGQLSLKPDWNKDMVFRLSGGLYQQPPFYRELRDATGTVNPEVKAQKSVHVVAANEYSFTWWQRPFTLNSEIYHKKLNNVNPYTLDDIRLRYAAQNNAKAYAYGADFRLNGAFVPGTESWVSVGFMKTEENIDNRGFIARPTDQRVKLGLLYQDYIPEFPDFKMYLNLVYNTGLPSGSPSYADPYIYQSRLRDYKRADLGISHIFAGGKKTHSKSHWLNSFKELSAGVEIFNLFNNQNSITNTWVRDVESKRQYAIPNFMTSRVLSARLRMRF
ncbi:TonB-dependent receptor plug domain-containing protein [Pseudozobellia sp. WGM2]|uniref:TonB-dependent receptor n=1 Tax=Pseudozobellia sp. WGM2 TaxID=2787625 RepID=UPI001ADF797F|nr:TonB-dependent receptor plug domain-containing protein [Pseudozobellia sp. WGM2]